LHVDFHLWVESERHTRSELICKNIIIFFALKVDIPFYIRETNASTTKDD